MVESKRQKTLHGSSDFFDRLPDDLVIVILCNLSFTANCPSDFICILLTCKRLNRLGLDPLVLFKAGPKTLAVRAKKWSEDANRFLKRCVFAGNIEACYTLGMIRFYCLRYRRSGLVLMAEAGKKSHGPALFSLAVIQFNGSGRTLYDRDLRAGVALSAYAASLNHIDALREVGLCLHDGYGVRQNVEEGLRIFSKADALEFGYDTRADDTRSLLLPEMENIRHRYIPLGSPGYGSGVSSPQEPHPVSRFLTEWFEFWEAAYHGLRLCSYAGCGRPETRPNEFRRCSACATVRYCSRACQARDWRSGHNKDCMNHQFERFAANGDGDEDHPMAEIEEAVNGNVVNDEEEVDDYEDDPAEIEESNNDGDYHRAKKFDQMVEIDANGDGRKYHENDRMAAMEDAVVGMEVFEEVG